MADDPLKQIEAALGAFSKMTTEDAGDDALAGARCPKCEASSFAKIQDLYDVARVRLEEAAENGASPADAPREGGLTDLQLVDRFAPPGRKSVVPRVLIVAVPAAAAAGYVYQRFGSGIGEFALIGAGVVVVITLLTTMRRLSDQYYDRRARWRKTYMCLKCGQLVAP